VNLVMIVAFGGLFIAAGLFVAALVRRRSLADRIIALDALLAALVAGLAVHAAYSLDGTFLDILVVASLLGFISTVIVARFIERRGA
jgi:multicomponent Na+:H+ antiporter subunit F